MPDSSEPQKTYLLDDIEVKKTGRVANRTLKNNKIDQRLEVTPADNADGSWKKWVRQTDLYVIEPTEE